MFSVVHFRGFSVVRRCVKTISRTHTSGSEIYSNHHLPRLRTCRTSFTCGPGWKSSSLLSGLQVRGDSKRISEIGFVAHAISLPSKHEKEDKLIAGDKIDHTKDVVGTKVTQNNENP